MSSGITLLLLFGHILICVANTQNPSTTAFKTDISTIAPTYYKYVLILSIIAFLASIFPVYHIYKEAICNCKRYKSNTVTTSSMRSVSVSPPPSSPKTVSTSHKQKTKSTRIELPLHVKIILSMSLTLSFIYLINNFIVAVFALSPSDPSNMPISYCKFLLVIQLVSYIVGRGLIYFFFILRSYYTFKDSVMAYNKSTIIIMLILPFIVFVLTLIPAVYEQYTNYTYFHGTDASGYGNICYRYRHTETRVFDVLSFLLFGTLCDILYAYLSVHILVSKLFKVIYIQSMQSMEKHDEEQNGSTLDTVEFHQKTRNSNKMVLIITKLVILLFIAVISTWTAIILLVFMGYWVYVIYSIDCCINIYCLWLNFEFSSKYYNKCFCGKQCIKLAFPTVKMLALTCTNCSDDDLNQCQKCGSCCCYCCKYCCAANKRQKQQNLYMMSKQETELMTL